MCIILLQETASTAEALSFVALNECTAEASKDLSSHKSKLFPSLYMVYIVRFLVATLITFTDTTNKYLDAWAEN